MTRHASDPDQWKQSDQEEGRYHYIDIDLLAPAPFENFPTMQAQAYEALGRDEVVEAGELPWRIEQYLSKLTAEFAAGNWRNIPLIASHLGHYVGDLHEPLHTTSNHDGQQTDNRGIHLRFEDEMADRFMDQLEVKASLAAQLSDPIGYVFNAIRSGYPMIDQIMIADDKAQQRADLGDEAYYESLFAATRHLVNDRLSKAATGLGSLIYTAWKNAGSPPPP